MRNPKEIIFPFFLHCCQETDDVYWKCIFEDLSYGKAPYGVYFTKGFMCCGFKGKEFSYKIDGNKPPPDLFQEVRQLLINNIGIRSSEDRAKQIENFDKKNQENVISKVDNWLDIRRKEIKHLLLENFVISIANIKKWPRIKTKKVIASVMLALHLKVIQPKHITIKQGEIISIENFEILEKIEIKKWNFSWKKKADQNSGSFLMKDLK